MTKLSLLVFLKMSSADHLEQKSMDVKGHILTNIWYLDAGGTFCLQSIPRENVTNIFRLAVSCLVVAFRWQMQSVLLDRPQFANSLMWHMRRVLSPWQWLQWESIRDVFRNPCDNHPSSYQARFDIGPTVVLGCCFHCLWLSHPNSRVNDSSGHLSHHGRARAGD